MTDITATVKSTSGTYVRSSLRDQDQINVRSSLSVAKRLEQFTNIDDTNLENGSMLVYKEPTENWTATRDLNQQNVDGGEF